jgi:hypothetical protein
MPPLELFPQMGEPRGGSKRPGVEPVRSGTFDGRLRPSQGSEFPQSEQVDVGEGFVGHVSYRSSKGRSGPPGEKAVLELNPQRRRAILKATGWGDLEPGTLNLAVAQKMVEELLS